MDPFEAIVRRRRIVLAVYAAATVAFLPGLLRLEIDNSPERFFVQDARVLERFRDLELRAGRDRAVRLVVPAGDVWTRESLELLGELEQRAQDPARVGGGVYGAAGLHRQHRWHLGGWPPADPEGFRELVTSDPLDREMGWVSRDGRYASVLVGLFKMPRERRESTLASLEALLPEDGFAMGVPVVNRALDRTLVDMARSSLPLLLAVALVLLLAAFRGPAALSPLALPAVSQTVLFGAMGYAGEPLDVVTVVLAPLLFVIAVATGVHVLAYHQRSSAAGLGRGEAALETYRVKAWPVFWTGMTTCAGFGSLAVSPVPPLRALGLWSAFGIALLTFAALTLYPALLAVAGPERRSERGEPHGPTDGSFLDHLSRLGGGLAAISVRRRGAVFAAFGLVALAAAAGLPRLGVETNILTYLQPDHPVRTRLSALEAAGMGSVSAHLVVSRPEGPPLSDSPSVDRLAEVAAALRHDPLVLGAVSAGDLLEGVARLDPAIDAAEAGAPTRARRRIQGSAELRPLLARLEARDGSRSRVLLATKMRSHRELEPLYRRAEALAARAIPDAEVWVTGLYPLVLTAQRTLLRTMLLSLSLTIAVIAAMLRGLLSSNALTWRVLVANLWPVLLAVGAMAWSGVPVESATVILGSLVLGLAVDDTLHTVAHFRRAMATSAGGATPAEAVVATLRETAPGHVNTSMVLTLGFAACALSPLVSVARVGGLAAVGIAGALAADLLLMPALLASMPVRER